MYKKILVPLDGSELAECVFPHLEKIIKSGGAEEIVLIQVVEPVMLPGGGWTDGGYVITPTDAEKTRKNLDDRNEAEAADYLAKIAGRFQSEGVKVQTAILKGKIADELVDYIRDSDAELIVIASHGRSGIGRWIFGSVTERLLRSVCMPILMVHVPGCEVGS